MVIYEMVHAMDMCKHANDKDCISHICEWFCEPILHELMNETHPRL